MSDAWIEYTNDDDPLAAESWQELLEADPTAPEFMPTKTPPPTPARGRSGYQPVHIQPPPTVKELSLLDPYDWHRHGGDAVKLGRCPLCGRNVTRSMCNKTGGRCRYEGAQFDASGKMVNKPWEAKPDPTARVTMRLPELNQLIDTADKALDGDSNDAEHDALFEIREQLAEMSTDPARRT